MCQDVKRNEVDIIVTNSPKSGIKRHDGYYTCKEFHDVFKLKNMFFFLYDHPISFKDFKNILY